MPIALHCKECDSDFHVKDELGGKSVKCPRCKEAILKVPKLVQQKQVVADQWQFKGLDGNVYGPTSKADLDQWVKDGRVSEQTQILAPGQDQWQWASTFYPELSLPDQNAQQPHASNYGVQAQPTPYQPQQYWQGVPQRSGPTVRHSHHQMSSRSKVAAGLLGLFLGGWGVHRFYLGFTGMGFLQIFVTIITCGIGGIWGFIEGILYLTGSMDTDVDGRKLTD